MHAIPTSNNEHSKQDELNQMKLDFTLDFATYFDVIEQHHKNQSIQIQNYASSEMSLKERLKEARSIIETSALKHKQYQGYLKVANNSIQLHEQEKREFAQKLNVGQSEIEDLKGRLKQLENKLSSQEMDVNSIKSDRDNSISKFMKLQNEHTLSKQQGNTNHDLHTYHLYICVANVDCFLHKQSFQCN
jgi:chromosome segregation ATPase